MGNKWLAIAAILIMAFSFPRPAPAEANSAFEQLHAVSTTSNTLVSETSIDAQISSSLESSKAVFLFFYADWCGHCKRQKPIIDELEREYSGEISFICANGDTYPQAMQKYGVREFPTMLLFTPDSVLANSPSQRFVGFTGEGELKRVLSQIILDQTDENKDNLHIQDISNVDPVITNSIHNTKYINNDSTGGDCTSIGTWDLTTKTCVLTTDLNETVVINADGITLDGNNHEIIGASIAYSKGVQLSGRTGVTIKNLKVKQFYYGIYSVGSSGNTFISNKLSYNFAGIFMGYWGTNFVANNTALNNFVGIYIDTSINNIVANNTASNNEWGFYLRGSCGWGCYYATDNILRNNIASNNKQGIRIDMHANNNKIYNNNFINNTEYQAYNLGGGNVFNLSMPTAGNYWSNYTGVDSNGDGIGDTPYTFTGGIDNYPFVHPSGWADFDSDGLCDPGKTDLGCIGVDNCPAVYNPEQIDSDEDGRGDACDNCPGISNPDQKDSEGLKRVWVEDSLPSGAIPMAASDSWNWVTDKVYSGAKSHKNNTVSGMHQHYFESASDTLLVSPGDYLIQYVYIPSGTVPREIMLQWREGSSWEHRAYWGENLIGGATRTYLGPVPLERDRWIRLEIPASRVGLEGKVLNGWAYTLYDGSIYWDYSAIASSAGDGIGDVCDNCPAVFNPDQTDADSDNYGAACDCDDNDSLSYPGAEEICDGKDNNCDGVTDVPDTIAPTTTLELSGTAGNNGWYRSDVTAIISANDTGSQCNSGVAKTEYSFDNASWFEYTEPLLLSDEGLITIYYRSIDAAGNMETTKEELIKIDKTAPAISATRSPDPNSYHWNNTNVTIHFAASDGISDIDSVTPDTVVTDEGAGQSVSGNAMDKAGNTAMLVVDDINIDKTPPTVTITSPEAENYLHSECLTIDFSATDALSDIDSIFALLNGTPVTNGQVIDLRTLPLGEYTLTVSAVDKAGNSTGTAITFTIEPVLAAVDIKPDTINKASQSDKNAVTVYIEIPGYDVNTIDVSTVTLSTNRGNVSAQLTPTEVGDYDGDGVTDFMVKFDRQSVIAIIDTAEKEIEITISGRIAGAIFKGNDTIRVIDKSK